MGCIVMKGNCLTRDCGSGTSCDPMGIFRSVSSTWSSQGQNALIVESLESFRLAHMFE